MFKIGEFARITGVTLRTLRHYDEMGLLSPSRLSDNDYRVYTASDLQKMQQILSLRDLGMPLDRIRHITEGLSREDFLILLREHRAALQQELEQLQTRISRLEHRLQEVHMYSPEIRSIPSRFVLSTQGTAQDYQHVTAPMNALWDRLCKHVEQHPVERTGPDTVIWYGDYGDMEAFTLELVFPVAAESPVAEGIRCYLQEATPEMAVVLHKGSYENLGDAYAALATFLEKENYERTGHMREVYLHFDQDEREHLTEIHVPVRKKS
ncbi:MerR family transcriptional regulator [Deinococcus cellulosilyticus]|uniref:MerR family transcriptional regulator n=1 Tax=Deinococcus cellulosilyticus (strain DSM 18568 / NBRC 106333 / KACC 11606 / 5516J-15) TaxID=1223518 RepID=A0A511MX03_DEIC1|nr:MerR family transcriptional regulator [Deinococcus cellulosilyticus]GEM45100.1 MerR family transcriptional regulator [Deinococcus cellulosilyticus NBRC 106333 = KACC 11606]